MLLGEYAGGKVVSWKEGLEAGGRPATEEAGGAGII
jgi:hypothetical protein